MTEIDKKKVRMVVMIDEQSNEINLIDESLVEVPKKNKIFMEKKNDDGSKTVTTNSLE